MVMDDWASLARWLTYDIVTKRRVVADWAPEEVIDLSCWIFFVAIWSVLFCPHVGPEAATDMEM